MVNYPLLREVDFFNGNINSFVQHLRTDNRKRHSQQFFSFIFLGRVFTYQAQSYIAVQEYGFTAHWPHRG